MNYMKGKKPRTLLKALRRRTAPKWPAHVMIQGKPYWGDYRLGVSVNPERPDAAAYLAAVSKEIADSQAARTGK